MALLAPPLDYASLERVSDWRDPGGREGYRAECRHAGELRDGFGIVDRATPMTNDNDETVDLLGRWHRGDDEALNELLERNLAWIRTRVHHRLGDGLRAKEETVDFVQEAMLELLRYGPRFVVENRAHFRALVARIVENVLRGKAGRYNAQRRQLARERPLPADSVVHLRSRGGGSVTTPSAAAENEERRARVRLAFELLEPEDREVLTLREWEKRSFREIGEQLGLNEDAARMRYNRTLPKLAQKLRQLRNGDLEGLLGEPPDGAEA